MKVNQVFITELPPEFGPDGERLVVLLENGRCETILIEQPLDTEHLADLLTHLANAIRAWGRR